MSHFSVLVIGPDPEGQLRPYEESPEKDDPFFENIIKFRDNEKENLKRFKTEKTDEWYCKHVEISNEQFSLVSKSKGVVAVSCIDVFPRFEKDKNITLVTWIEPKKENGKRKRKEVYANVVDFIQNQKNHICYASVRKIDPPAKISFKKKYKTFENFMEEYCGYSERDPKTGKYGYWHNPQAKWDWYSLGGRWTGYFKLKNNVVSSQYASVGRPGLMTEPAEPGTADQALKSDIDFEAMLKENTEKANKNWLEIEKLLATGNKSDKQKTYWEYGYKDEGKEKYLKGHSSWSTFAVVKDGKWYEKGDMGWWGMVSDEKDVDKWQGEFTKLVEGLPDDTLFSLYDLHI